MDATSADRASPDPARAEPEALRESLLASVLGAHQLRATIVAVAGYCGDWFEREPQTLQGSFHLIDEGECWAHGAGLSEPLHLGAGDLIVFPRGAAHTLHGGHGERRPESGYSTLICGEFRFASESRNPLLQALPEVFVVRAGDSGAAFRELGQVLSDFARRKIPGQQAILDKLADSLFTMAVCAHAAQARDHRGLLAALADTRLAKALAAIHLQPGVAWRVETLAQKAGMSRTAFAVEFTRLLGVSPIQYLTEWRVAEARRLLRDRRLSVATIAERLGYHSEAAFRRTFKRIEGVGPGELRRTAGHA